MLGCSAWETRIHLGRDMYDLRGRKVNGVRLARKLRR